MKRGTASRTEINDPEPNTPKADPVKDKATIIKEASKEISTMFKRMTKDEDLEPLKIYFSTKNEDLSSLEGKDIMNLFLDHYHNAFAKPAFVRTSMVPALYKELGLSTEEFIACWNAQLAKICTMDLPFIKKTSANIMCLMAKENAVDFSAMEFTFSGDEFTREDQMWFFKDMLEEAGKLAKAAAFEDEGFSEMIVERTKFAEDNFKA